MDLLSHAWQIRWKAVTSIMAPWQHLKDHLSPYSLSLLPFLNHLMGEGHALSFYLSTEADYSSEKESI